MVCMLNPPNLHMAFGLDKMQEENVAALRRSTKSGPMPIRNTIGPIPTRPTIGPMDPHEKRVIVPIQRLSQMQMKERRDKGLCYNCDDKWGPGHKCKSARLFLMESEESDYYELIKAEVYEEKIGSNNEEVLAELVEPKISIHALCGSPSPKTMRFVGHIGKRAVVILVDTGSTHNFIDPSVVRGA